MKFKNGMTTKPNFFEGQTVLFVSFLKEFDMLKLNKMGVLVLPVKGLGFVQAAMVNANIAGWN